ncbi:MAG: hypothetical protein K0R29_2321 [Pseudobdellovibrio sp.]|jgi:hypothetical protein|nr:hypothetical protein [Pseudobdellovibrio sp.]
MNTKLGLFAAALLTGLFSQFSHANCRLVSLEKNPVRYIYNMIKSTPDIYYAEATSYSTEDEAFSFKVIETFKGEKRKDFTVLGTPVDYSGEETDFGGHKAQAFWDDITTARTKIGSDCRLAPKFKTGSRYLIFFKEPYQAKSFELVKNRGDRWYKHVWETLYPPKKKKTPVAAASATEPAATAPSAPPPAADPGN